MNTDELRLAIKDGENIRVEFKRSLSSTNAKSICKEIAALATTDGGLLIIGVDDAGTVVGVENATEVRDKVERWIAETISPMPTANPIIAYIDNVSLLVFDVKKGNSPFYLFNGAAYARIGTSSIAMSAQHIIDSVRGMTVEQIIDSMQSSLASAYSALSSALDQPAPAIYGQGELATSSYQQIRERIFAELQHSAAFAALESLVSVANSTASIALASAAPAIQGQGDLATQNYAQVLPRIVGDIGNSDVISLMKTESILHSHALSVQQNELATINAELATVKAHHKDLLAHISAIKDEITVLRSQILTNQSETSLLQGRLSAIDRRLDVLKSI